MASADLFNKLAVMNSEFTLDYWFAVESPTDAHHARKMSDLMETSPHPIGFGVQCSTPYSSRFLARSFGDVGLLEYQMDSPAGKDNVFVGERTRTHMARNLSLEYQICVWLGGEHRLKIGNRMHSMQAGDFFVTSTEIPFCAHMLNRGHTCCFALPASWDRMGDTRLENTFGKIYPGHDGCHNGLVNYARHLLARPNALALPGASAKLHDVIALALSPRATSDHQAGLLAMMHSHIDAHYSNPDLDPDEVATAFRLSVRHLHRLFSASGTSFTEYLIGRRLAQARRLLSDPRCRHKTILSIAYDCGFRDINHFGQRFRACCGATASEFRQKLHVA